LYRPGVECLGALTLFISRVSRYTIGIMLSKRMALAASNASNLVPAPPVVVPSVPVSVTAVQVTSEGGFSQEIVVSWSEPVGAAGAGINNYRVYRDTSPGATTLVGSTDGSTLTFNNNFGIGNRGATFYYRVRAENIIGLSAYSNEASATTTVICTELYRQGLLPYDIYLADAEFGRRAHPYTKAGYLLWAQPVVCLMQRSASVTRVVHIIATPWTLSMAKQVGVRTEGSVVGTALMVVGVPVCWFLGWGLSSCRSLQAIWVNRPSNLNI